MTNPTIGPRLNRRRMLAGLGLAGAATILGPRLAPAVAQAENIDVAVLNFALNLEYLEAEFYLAAVGRTPSYATDGVGDEGEVIGGREVNFASDAIREYAEEIATDEENHVKFLRTALGDAAVARPKIDIGPAFAVAANAAFGTTLNPPFDPYENDLFFLHGAFIFEDVGVTAYKGAARLLTDKGILLAAAKILAVEAYHAGEIRTLLYGQKDVVSPYGVTVETIVQKISDLRDAVDRPEDTDQGVVLNGRANIVLADQNAIAFSRSTAEVLKIVYLGGTNSGGFFPDGLNGAIR